MPVSREDKRIRAKRRIRKKINGSADRPRLTVYRSNTGIYAQLVDDISGKTICSASWTEFKEEGLQKSGYSEKVGKKIAEIAKEKGIEKVVFDRNGYLYHGRVKALAEAAREGGLIF